MSSLAFHKICKTSVLKNVAVLTNNRFLATSLELNSAKNSKPRASKAKKNPTPASKKEEKSLIPQDQNEFDQYIASYRNEDYYQHNPYSYYDYETEMLPRRQPQPKKPALF